MANQRVFSIQINGIVESTNAVNALNESLDKLNERIKEVEKRAIKINASSSSDGYGTSSKSSSKGLSEEEKLTRQIAQNEEKRATYSKEIYKDYLASKDLLKETVNDQKQIAASQRLAADTYSNTMQGMKDKLADLKAMINTTDLGDSDQINKMVAEADQLNTKIKQIEESYGQFGRNVGNYKSALDGIKGITITVDGVERTFGSAREATRTLRNELVSLEVAGQGSSETAKQLRAELNQLQSAMNDATVSSKAMDEAMDFMQSFTAMASVGQGLKGFFGFDDNEIQKSIQKLVSLQNVLKGIETIRKQMDSNEGIGMIFAKGNEAINTATNRLLVYNRALLGTGTAAKAAAVGINILRGAMKAVGIGLVIEGVVLLTDGIQKLINSMDTSKAKANALDSELNVLNNTYENLREEVQYLYDNNAISKQEYVSRMFKLQNEQLGEQIKLLKQRAAVENESNNHWYNIGTSKGFTGEIFKPQTLETSQNFFTAINDGLTLTVKNLSEVDKEWQMTNQALKEGKDYFDKWGEGLSGTVAASKVSVEETQKMLVELGNVRLSDLIGQFQKARDEYANGTISLDQYKSKITELYNLMNSNEVLKSVLANLEKYIPSEAVRAQIQDMINSINSLYNSMSNSRAIANFTGMFNQLLDAADKTGERARQKQRDQWKGYYESLPKYMKGAYKFVFEQGNKLIDQSGKQATSSAKKTGNALKDITVETNRLQIEAMREGLTKTLAQLQLERNRRIQEAKKTGRQVNEQIASINRLYEQKEFDAKAEYYRKLVEQERKLGEELANVAKANNDKMVQNTKLAYENILREGINNLPKELSDFEEEFKKGFNIDYGTVYNEKVIADYKRVSATIKTATKAIEDYNNGIITDTELVENWKKQFDDATDELWELIAKYPNIANEAERVVNVLLSSNYAERYSMREMYYEKVKDLAEENAKKQIELTRQTIRDEQEQLVKAEDERHNKILSNIYDEKNALGEIPRLLLKSYEESYDNGELDGKTKTQIGYYLSNDRKSFDEYIKQLKKLAEDGKLEWKDYNDVVNSEIIASYIKRKDEYENFLSQYNRMSEEDREKNKGELKRYEDELNAYYIDFLNNVKQELRLHNNVMSTIDKEAKEKGKNAELEYRDELSRINAEYFSNLERETERGLAAVNQKLGKAEKRNSFGFINLKETKRNLNDLRKTVEIAIVDIGDQKKELQEAFDSGEISFEDFNTLDENLSNLDNNARETLQNIQNESKEVIPNFIADIEMYVQAFGQTIQGIFDAVAGYEDYKFDKLQEEMDKMNEMLEKKLDEQEEIIEKHKDNVNDIEDELAESRGDRRQHLIDLLNQEIAAQRTAEAEKQSIEKRQEALEKQKEALEKKRKKAEYKRNLMSILVNNAMAISAAAVNPWPVPAIPMVAAATALGVLQYAMAAKAKPYKRGGQLEGGLAVGKRHRDGGIPVLGGRASIEGGEFITNRISTAKNIDLLEFVNSKKKKVELSDMVDFYKGNVRSTVSQTRSRFEDGGMLPTMSNNIDIDEQIRDVIMVQSKQPIYVTVKDIEDRMSAVNKVRVLAGMQN